LEAAVARDLDKVINLTVKLNTRLINSQFEMIVQANEYEIAQGKRLDSFFESTKGVFIHHEVTS
jgi:hypothetical protein